MTVDVEDYFHVSAFEHHIAREDWKRLPQRVERNTYRILELFEEAGVSATFFALGWVAEKNPALVRDIAAAGHEVASHGYAHVRATETEPKSFRADVSRTKRLLEDVTGQSVAGYRAASFSITKASLWAVDILAETGHLYSSSVYPVRHDIYGMPQAPRFPFRHEPAGLLELPMTTASILGLNLPCSGGGYFRLFPYWFTRRVFRRVNEREGYPVIFYFHPWEIDPEQPRQHGLDYKTRFRHYNNLTRMESRLRLLLHEFQWDRIDRVFPEAAAI